MIKSLVTGWVKGTTDNYGVLVKGVDESQSRRLRRAYSSESISSNKPELHVSYYLPKVVYYLKDHLGSTRVVVDEDGGVVESYDYFPFGLTARSAGTGTKYKFTEKELDNETDFYYFGARYYDAEVGRFISPDPLANKYPGWSPYVYSLDNPIIFVDFDGYQVRIYVWFNKSTLTEQQRQQVLAQIRRAWLDAGVRDVKVRVADWFHRNILGAGVLGNLDVKFLPVEGPPGTMGETEGRGIGRSIVYEKSLPVDKPATEGKNERIIAAGNVANHELGHGAGLDHPKDEEGLEYDDASIMGTNVSPETYGDYERRFNEENKKELQKKYNR